MRLVMTREHGFRLGRVRPLGEPLPPPKVVFRNGMVLWQVKGDQPGPFFLVSFPALSHWVMATVLSPLVWVVYPIANFSFPFPIKGAASSQRRDQCRCGGLRWRRRLMRSPRVLISLVNWNGGAVIARCVEQLRAQTFPNAQIIVVDNGSTDGSLDALRRADPGIVVLENFENRGYSGGHNEALRYGLRESFDYFWLLNHDTTLEPGTLAALVDAAESDRTIGAVSPVIYEAAEPERIQFCGSLMQPREFSVPTVREIPDSHVGESSHSGHLLLWGTAMLVRREAIQAAGLL